MALRLLREVYASLNNNAQNMNSDHACFDNSIEFSQLDTYREFGEGARIYERGITIPKLATCLHRRAACTRMVCRRKHSMALCGRDKEFAFLPGTAILFDNKGTTLPRRGRM